MSRFNLRRSLAAGVAATLAAAGVVFVTATSAAAWSVPPPAVGAQCVNNKVVLQATVLNTEPKPSKGSPSDWNDMKVTATYKSLSDGPKLAIASGPAATFTINTGLTSVPDGTVNFKLEWANSGRSGTDSRSASFKAITCKPNQPDPKITYSEWQDGDKSCATGKVTQTRTKTSTPWIWDEAKGEYVPDPAHATTTTETGSRDMTADELKVCNSPPDGGYVCHATSSFSNPFSLVPASTAGLANGHMGHTGGLFDGVTRGWGDIIPPFVYQGVTYSMNWPAGQAIWANGCKVDKPEPPEPKVVHQSDDKKDCDGVFHREWDLVSFPVWNDETGTYDFGDPVVKNDTGWVKVRDLTPSEKKELDCDKPDKPEPIVEPLQDKQMTCENGVEKREGTKTTDWVFDENTWTWVKGEPVVEWGDWTFVRDLTRAEQIKLGCVEVVDVPGKPGTDDPCGLDNVRWSSVPSDTDKLDWTLNEDGSLTVAPQPGFVFDQESQSVTFYLPEDSGELCVTSPVNPSVTQAVCTGPGQHSDPTITPAADTDQVTYELVGQTVFAHATDDWKFGEVPDGWVVSEDGKTATYAVVFTDPGACLVSVTPVAFSQESPTCTEDGSLTIPAQPVGVLVSPEAGTYGPGEYDVTYSAVKGYVLETNPSGHVVVLAATGYQDESPNAGCYVHRDPTKKVTHSKRQSCELGGVERTTAVTTTTWAFDEALQQWVDTVQATSSTSFEPYTHAQLVAKGCVKPPTPPTPTPGHSGDSWNTPFNPTVLISLMLFGLAAAGGVVAAVRRKRV